MKRNIFGIFLTELLVGAGGGAVTAAIILPAIAASRGEFSIGGEWFIIAFAVCVTYFFYHRWIFGILENEAKLSWILRKEVRRRGWKN